MLLGKHPVGPKEGPLGSISGVLGGALPSTMIQHPRGVILKHLCDHPYKGAVPTP